jgi:flagellar P-ring protein precursor FlgI
MRTFLLVVLCLICAPCAMAVKIADITHISGQRTNVLTGMGLVYGLNGTGDGGDFLPAIKPLVAMLSKFDNATAVKELGNAKNVALVSITATIPADGARAGEPVDCYVTSIGAAGSLKGGRLFIVPMLGPTAQLDQETNAPFAMASGAVDLEDPSTPTTGVIKGGCVMESDWLNKNVDKSGRFMLIVEAPSASWTTASTIAKIINESEGEKGETLAVAVDAKTVIVTIPVFDRARPDGFISRIQRMDLPMLSSEARVQVNTRKGSIVMTGDVEISPVVISIKGLTISTVTPPPVGTSVRPILGEKNAVAMDTTGTGGAKLNDLLAVFDQLKVPAEDRISILEELHKTGKLHAKLVME